MYLVSTIWITSVIAKEPQPLGATNASLPDGSQAAKKPIDSNLKSNHIVAIVELNTIARNVPQLLPSYNTGSPEFTSTIGIRISTANQCGCIRFFYHAS